MDFALRALALALIAIPIVCAGHVHADDTTSPNGAPASPISFLRGDTNGDGSIDLADAAAFIGVLSEVYSPPCIAALDYDSDGEIDLSDLVAPLAYLFAAGSPPPAPFPACDQSLPGVGIDCSVSTCAP